MALTQESVVSLLVAEGGKVKKSDLVVKFRDSVECVDPEQKERNRELFKTFVNNVAFVKEIDGVRYVVLKKTHQDLLGGVQKGESHLEKCENQEIRVRGEQQRPPERDERTEKSVDPGEAGKGGTAAPQAAKEKASEGGENPAESLSLVELALQRSKSEIKGKRMLNFDINKKEKDKDELPKEAAVSSNKVVSMQSKPYALPLRMAPSATRVEIHKLKVQPNEPMEISKAETFRNKKRPSSVETGRAVKKVSEEPKDIRGSSMSLLEHAEHEWFVKCAAGLWTQVYGLLLRDCHLVKKRDFMSGFTVLHWAAKCGNSKILTSIIDTSRHGGADVDVNVRSHGGYTPLHIAALHDQEYIMTMLVAEYGANTSIRDNSGKKAYHYLHKGIAPIVREMLGEPKAQQAQDKVVLQKDELDLFPDLPKGLHSISRLFQPAVTGHKKKQNHRSGLYSLGEESEEREHSSFRSRTVSDASVC